MRGSAQDPDPPGGVLDDRQHIHRGFRRYLLI